MPATGLIVETSSLPSIIPPQVIPASAPAESRYRALIDTRLGIVWRAAPDLSVLDAWGWEDATGQPKSEYAGDGWLKVVHPEDRDEVLAILARARRLGQACEGAYRARQADGRYRWLHARVVPLRNDSGEIHEWVGHLIDVHDKVEADAALRTAEERLRLALESSAVGVWEYDFRTQVGWWSESKRAVVGLPEDYPITQDSFLALVHPEDRGDVEARIERAKQFANGGRFDAEFRVRGYADGAEVWIASRGQVLFDAAGEPVRILGTMRDITADRAAQQRLYHLAHFDQLTGLANRVHFVERLEQLLASCAAGLVVLLDLDGFKNVNDTAGHHAGDLLLRTVARRVAEALPAHALPARWGGDEFAIFVPDVAGSVSRESVVQSIAAVFERPFSLPGREVFLSTSMGIAIATDHGTTGEELLLHADLALCQSKTEGRGLGCVFRPAFKQEAERRIDLEADLRRALLSCEFEMHYQPQVALGDGEIVGAEALLRWRHPEKGLLLPAAFLPVLTASPIALTVGDWTLATACAWAARCLQARRPVRVAVNLFGAQISAGGLLQTVRRCLNDSELPPELLELEITETSILTGDVTTSETLAELRRLGVGIAFDDYGTGYASLSMLTDYPLTRLKIDRKFVQYLSNHGNKAVVQAIVQLGHAFGLKVVAEGIESEEQAQMLRALGCDEGQGYLYSRPILGEDLLSVLKCADWLTASRSGPSDIAAV